MVSQSWKKYQEQNKRIKQNWTESGNFNVCFCVIFDRYCQSLIPRSGTGC